MLTLPNNFAFFPVVAFKERPPSSKAEKSTAKSKDKGGKGGKAGKGDKDKDKASRPPSQQFDVNRPNWTLRVVSDGAAAVSVSLYDFVLYQFVYS